MACYSGAYYQKTIEVEPDRVAFLHARVCRNNLCNEGPLISDDYDIPGALMVDAQVDARAAPTMVVWLRASVADESALLDDDVYHFVLFDAQDGTVFADDTAAGPYCLLYPNGIQCGSPCRVVYVGKTDRWEDRTQCPQ